MYQMIGRCTLLLELSMNLHEVSQCPDKETRTYKDHMDLMDLCKPNCWLVMTYGWVSIPISCLLIAFRRLFRIAHSVIIDFSTRALFPETIKLREGLLTALATILCIIRRIDGGLCSRIISVLVHQPTLATER